MQIKKEKIIEVVWFIVIIGIFVLSLKFLKSGELESRVESFGMLAPLVFVILKMATLIIAPLGGGPLYIIAGALFGTFKGFLLSLLGDILGAAGCFLIARKFGEKIVKLLVGDNFFAKVKTFLNVLSSGKSFIKARIAGATLPELIAYAAGLSSLNFWKFLIINSIFHVPGDFILVFLGAQITSISIQYIFILYGAVTVITVLGFWFLYKDYENMTKV